MKKILSLLFAVLLLACFPAVAGAESAAPYTFYDYEAGATFSVAENWETELQTDEVEIQVARFDSVLQEGTCIIYKRVDYFSSFDNTDATAPSSRDQMNNEYFVERVLPTFGLNGDYRQVSYGKYAYYEAVSNEDGAIFGQEGDVLSTSLYYFDYGVLYQFVFSGTEDDPLFSDLETMASSAFFPSSELDGYLHYLEIDLEQPWIDTLPVIDMTMEVDAPFMLAQEDGIVELDKNSKAETASEAHLSTANYYYDIPEQFSFHVPEGWYPSNFERGTFFYDENGMALDLASEVNPDYIIECSASISDEYRAVNFPENMDRTQLDNRYLSAKVMRTEFKDAFPQDEAYKVVIGDEDYVYFMARQADEQGNYYNVAHVFFKLKNGISYMFMTNCNAEGEEITGFVRLLNTVSYYTENVCEEILAQFQAEMEATDQPALTREDGVVEIEIEDVIFDSSGSEKDYYYVILNSNQKKKHLVCLGTLDADNNPVIEQIAFMENGKGYVFAYVNHGEELDLEPLGYILGEEPVDKDVQVIMDEYSDYEYSNDTSVDYRVLLPAAEEDGFLAYRITNFFKGYYKSYRRVMRLDKETSEWPDYIFDNPYMMRGNSLYAQSFLFIPCDQLEEVMIPIEK